MTINEFIKKIRKNKGLSVKELAISVGLSVDEYYDIEAYPDEIVTTVKLNNIKKLCEALSIDFLELFKLDCIFCKNAVFETIYFHPRNEIIEQSRQKLGLSKYRLGDLIDFFEEAINSLENDKNFIEGWPVDVIINLSERLKLPVQVLLGVKCKKCGR